MLRRRARRRVAVLAGAGAAAALLAAPPVRSESVLEDHGKTVYLWGSHGVGKTHLLQALCNELGALGQAVAYLPMQVLVPQLEPAALEGLEGLHLICIDDLDEIAGHEEWEHAVSGLLDRVQESGAAMVLAGRCSPERVSSATSALSFRLGLTLRLALEPVGAEDAVWALQLKARARGAKLPAAVARYLIRHYGSDMAGLARLIETLDFAALASKRKITKPFIRSVLARQQRGK